jgi:hypothetical protein
MSIEPIRAALTGSGRGWRIFSGGRYFVTDIFISLWCVDEVSLKSALLDESSEKEAESRELDEAEFAELPEKDALLEPRAEADAELPRPRVAA